MLCIDAEHDVHAANFQASEPTRQQNKTAKVKSKLQKYLSRARKYVPVCETDQNVRLVFPLSD